ncbi:Apc13p protein-domain-containing protein [Delphinella strobiligena]|nr:Apc13p protein-domain-containing protein [Delphinella strobiligena]
MTKDSNFTHLLLHSSHHADLLEDFTRAAHLPAEEIYVPPQHQPLNPDDEDDVVPEQHAAFGIQRATQRSREPAWRDLGLERILDGGPPAAEPGVEGSKAASPGATGAASRVRMMR